MISNFTKRNLHHFTCSFIQQYNKDIIKKFYNLLQESHNRFSNLEFKYDIYEIEEDLKSNIESYYFPLSIQNSIRENLRYIYKCSITIQHRSLFIYIISKDVNEKYEDYMIIIMMWIYILYSFSQDECTQSLNIYLYLSENKKQLPYKKSLSTENINSGYSHPGCNEENKIVIYRNEEWFKVLLHETIHAFNLDFSVKSNNYINQKLNHIFPLNFPFNAYECYCETWATIWNTIFISFLEEKHSFNKFSKLFLKYFSSECSFTTYQCNKILNNMNIKYHDLFNSNTEYKETTNIFSYFFLKRICIDNINEFLNICNNNNKFSIMKFDENTYDPFINLIYDNYRKYDTINNDNITDEIDKTLRMTLLDFE